MRLVFVGDRCSDHSPSSGYDQVCGLFPDAGWLSGRGLSEGTIHWHRRADPVSRSAPLVFHVLYGDCSGRHLPGVLRTRFPGAAIVSTVHQPVERILADPLATSALQTADVVLTVAQSQADELAFCGPVRVVPHGVWGRAFRPSRPSGVERGSVLVVGNYLRDWADTQGILDSLAAVDIPSVVIGSHAPQRLSFSSPLVQILPRMDEAELAARYDAAATLLLAVEDATSCNALLEAMAAGCPVVCTDVPALVDDYLGDRSDAFPRGGWAIAVARLRHYVEEPQHRARRSWQLRQRAQLFDWGRLRQAYTAAYEAALLEAPSPVGAG